MKPVTFRPSDLLHAEITKRAKLDRRSVNVTVCLLLESALGQPTQAATNGISVKIAKDAPTPEGSAGLLMDGKPVGKVSIVRSGKREVQPRFKAGVLPKATKG